MSTCILFGAGADIDAAPDSAGRGDQLLLNTFRKLDAAKEHAGYRSAFTHLFGSESQLSYSWKRSVKDMIERALRNNSMSLLGGTDGDHTLPMGSARVRIAPKFLDILQEDDPANNQARSLVFHVIFAMYGAEAVGQLVNSAPETIGRGLAHAGVEIPEDVYNQIDLQVRHNPEQALVEAATQAIQQSIGNAKRDAGLDAVLVRLLDYTVVFDQVFADLTTDKYQVNKPNGHTAPLRRAMHFLFALNLAAHDMDGEPGSDSYYHRIPEDAAVFTMNYTEIVQQILQQRGIKAEPVYLHGKHSEFFDLLTGQLNPEQGGLPFIMPQTSSKPIASVETIRRFARFLRALDRANTLVTVGYGFNRDDDHVSNMIHDAMLQNTALAMKILARDDIASSPGVQRLQEQFGERVETVQVAADEDTARDVFSEVVGKSLLKKRTDCVCVR